MWWNKIIIQLLRWGINPAPNYIGHAVLVSIPGRKSGKVYTTPLSVIKYQEKRYIIGGSNHHQWVKNLRVAGCAILSKGQYEEHVMTHEIEAPLRSPIIKYYLGQVRGARISFAVDFDASLDAFEKVAANYPVFQLTSKVANEFDGI